MTEQNRRRDDKLDAIRHPGTPDWSESIGGQAATAQLTDAFKAQVRGDFEALVRANAPIRKGGENGSLLARHGQESVFQAGQYVDPTIEAEWIGYSARAAQEFRTKTAQAAPASADNPSTAGAEPVAYLHQVVCGDGEPDQALSFAPDNFPLAGTLGYRSISHQPLFLAAPVAQSTAGAANFSEQQIADFLDSERLVTKMGHRALINGDTMYAGLNFLTNFANAVVATLAAPAAQAPMPVQWISVEDHLPEKYCLAAYLTRHGRFRIIRAMYVKQYEIEATGDECDSEYSEADDLEYIKAGWYECIDNWGEYSSCAVNEGKVKFWMPLPAAPEQSALGEKGGDGA